MTLGSLHKVFSGTKLNLWGVPCNRNFQLLLAVQKYTKIYIASKIAFLKAKGNVRKGRRCTALPIHPFYMVIIAIILNMEIQR